MTKPAHGANPRWLGFLLAALVAVLVILFGAGTASAATATAAQTRVGAHTLVAQALVGSQRGIGAGQRLGNDHPAHDFVLATGVAAETATTTAEDGGGLLSRLRSFNWRDDTGAINLGGRNSEDQNALIQLAKEAKRTGVSNTDAQTLLDWADEVGLPGRGPEIHLNRPTLNFPHIHIGPVGHIPVL